MKCLVAKAVMSTCLDGVASRNQMAQLDEHLRACAECAARMAALRQTQMVTSSLGRKVAPPDLSLKLRVALSQQIANSRTSQWDKLRLRWDNAFKATMVPATAAVLTTLIIFGGLISFLYPAQVEAANDVPTMLYTPAELKSTPFALSMGVGSSDSLIVEAYVGSDGRVQDYRILSAAADAQALLPELKNMLIFATFHPATAFGQPTASRVVLTFSKVQVNG